MATMWSSHAQGHWPQQQSYGYHDSREVQTPMPNAANHFDSNTDIICDNCRHNVPPGPQWHCSVCAGGDFDICDGCRRNGISCHCGGLFPLTIIPGYGRERNMDESAQPPSSSYSATATTYPPSTSYPVTSSYHSYASAPPPTQTYSSTSTFTTAPAYTVTSTAAPHNYNSYTTTPQLQPLSALLPASATLKEWTANPSLNAFLHRFTQYTKSTQHSNPAYETLMCRTPDEYDAWLMNTHEPQDGWYEQIITCLTDLNESITRYVEEKARSGLEIWGANAYPTKDGEVSDCFDIMVKVIEKVDELRKAQQSHQDDNNRQWVGSRGAQAEEDVQKLVAWYNAAALENATNGSKARMQRRSEFADLVRRVVAKADEKERLAFETILASTSNALSSSAGNDKDMLVKAVQVLSVHLEVRGAMQARLANAAMEQVAAEHSYKVTQITEASQEDALVQEGNGKLDQIELARDTELKRLADEWESRVSRPIIPVVAAMQGGVTPAAPTGAPLSKPPASTVPGGAGGTGASRSVTISRSVHMGGPQTGAATGGSRLPLSFFSNLLHQQHVTNMNIINNIGDGNTQYWSMNPVTGQINY